jgi:sulfur carrier protein
MVTITLNGKAQEVPEGLTLPGLLAHLELEGMPLVVEHNRTALLKSEWPTTNVQDGDEIEFIRVVAGG